MPHPLSHLFHPQHIAIIGASEQPDSFGERIFSMLHSTELQAKITPLNLHHRNIGGLPAFPSLSKLPKAADLAVITTPPATYDSLFKACLKQQIRHIVLLQNWSAFDEDTLAVVEKSLAKARKQKLSVAVCDPAGLHSPAYGLHINLYRHRPHPGNIALLAHGHSLPNLFNRWQLGISKQVTLNETLQGLSAAEFIDYLREDKTTGLLVVQFPEGQTDTRFFSALRQAALKFPLILHAPQCLSEIQVSALQQWCVQHGLILSRSPAELNAAVRAAQSQLPAIDRLLLSGNSEAGWLAETHTGIPPAGLVNEAYLPDNLGTLPFCKHVHQLLDTPENDAVLVLIEPTIYQNEGEIHHHLSRLQQQHAKPLLIVSPFSDRHLLHFQTVEEALSFCRALQLAQYAKNEALRLPTESSRPQGLAKPDILKKLIGQPQKTLQDIGFPLSESPAVDAASLSLQADDSFGMLLHLKNAAANEVFLPPFSGLTTEKAARLLNLPADHANLKNLIGIANQILELNLPLQRWSVYYDAAEQRWFSREISFREHALQPYTLSALPPKQVMQTLSLKNGEDYRIRTILPDDAAALQRFVRKLSAASRKTRFMSPLRELPPSMLARFCRIDYARECGIVAEAADGRIVAHAQYSSERAGEHAEFAIMVDDALQGQGLARALMETLIEQARRQGYQTLSGEILRDNPAMRKLAEKLGFTVKTSPQDSTLYVANLPLTQPQNSIKMKLTQQILAPKS